MVRLFVLIPPVRRGYTFITGRVIKSGKWNSLKWKGWLKYQALFTHPITLLQFWNLYKNQKYPLCVKQQDCGSLVRLRATTL